MSAGVPPLGKSFLLIDERELWADEVTRRHRRRLLEDEPQGLTSAQKQVWNALHFLLHRRSHGYREGYCSYAEIADFCGLAPSTVVEAIKALVEAGLLLKRRRRDPRGKRGPSHFYAPNAYWLLPPKSIRTAEEEQMVVELKALWGEDEQLPPRRQRPSSQVPLFPARADVDPILDHDEAPSSTPGQKPAENASPLVDEKPRPSPASPPIARLDPQDEADRQAARDLVAEFHRAAGLGSSLGAAELALARELIAKHGVDAVRDLGRHVIDNDKPRSFMLVKFHLNRQPRLIHAAQAPSIISEALGVRIEALKARIEKMRAIIYADPSSPLVVEVVELENWHGCFYQPNAFDSEERAAACADRLETKISAFEADLGI
jgi:DNA-binding MarR family transcriptional regulator